MEESGADDGERLRKRRKTGFMWAETEMPRSGLAEDRDRTGER